jgi:hypothetical protein
MLQKLEIEKVLLGTFVCKIGRIGFVKEFDVKEGKVLSISIVDGESMSEKYPPLWHKINVSSGTGFKPVIGRIVEVFGREAIVRKEFKNKDNGEVKEVLDRVIFVTCLRMYNENKDVVEFEYIVPKDKTNTIDNIVKEIFTLK